MVEVGLVDVEVHHARVRTSDLGDVRVAETTTHLSGTAPVLDLRLNSWIATFYDTSDDSRALTSTVEVGNHLTDGTASVEVAQPGGNIGLGIVGCQLLLQVHDDNGYVEVTNGRQHIIRGTVSQHL